MTRKFILLLILGLQFFTSSSLFAKDKLSEREKKHLNTLYSFENGKVPRFIKFKNKRSVRSSVKYSQDKEKSLEWRPDANDNFTVQIGNIGNPFGASGGNNYFRSAFRLAIRSHDKGGVVDVAFQDKKGADIAVVKVAMQYDGWQNLIYHYSSMPKFDWYAGKGRLKDITQLVVRTSDDYPKGEPLFIDSLKLNYHVEWRQFITKRDPARFYKRIDILNNFDDPRIKGLDRSILDQPTAEELAGLELIKKRSLGNGAWRGGWKTMKQLESVRKYYKDKYGMYRNEFGIARGHAKWFIHITDEMRKVGNSYLPTADPEVRDATEDLFILLFDLLEEMGAKLNGPYGMSNYIGRPYADAIKLMHKVLRKHGRLKNAVRKLEQNYGYNRIFDVPSSQFNMDHFHNEVRYRILIAILQDTVHEQVIHLRILSKVISQQILADGVLQVDGSLYHHGMNYYSYGGLGIAGLGRVINKFSSTPFQISKKAFDKYKSVVMKMRWYSNTTDLPLTLHGRSPGSVGLPSTYLHNVYYNSGHFNGGKADEKVGAAYLRFLKVESERSKRAYENETNRVKKGHRKKSFERVEKKIKDLVAKGLKAEKAPTGNRTMPYAGTSMHRRDEWLAHVRGFGSGLKAFETYGASGRYNLFIANGYLDIYSSGNPLKEGISGYASGYRPGEGWDWRYLDGTTSILMPYAKMSFGNNTGADGSSAILTGGLSHRGWNGVFSMPLVSHQQHKKAKNKGAKGGTFRANKSYFFFDDRIVCLGSDVNLDNSEYEVITTLFQKALDRKDNKKVTTVNGQKVSSLDYTNKKVLSSNNWLIDPYETGYYVPKGQSLKIVHSKQNSRIGNDTAATEGYYAKAYLSHGENPTDADYSYVALVKTDAEKMKAFHEAMQDEATAPVEIVAKDKTKHIVFDRQTQSWGAVLYKGQKLDHTVDGKKFLIKSVDQACLAMVEHTANPGVILVSLSRPDYRYAGKKIYVDLIDGWNLAKDQAADLPEGLRADNGRISVPITHGRSYTIAFENPALKTAEQVPSIASAKNKGKTSSTAVAAEGEKEASEEESTGLSEQGLRQLKIVAGAFVILFLIWILYLFNRKPRKTL